MFEERADAGPATAMATEIATPTAIATLRAEKTLGKLWSGESLGVTANATVLVLL